MSRIDRAIRRRASAVLAAAVTLGATPGAAWACSVCMSGREDENRLAFILTTALLTVLPLAMIGGLVWTLHRRVRRIEAERVEAAGRLAPPLSAASR